MKHNLNKIISQCQNDLNNKGYTISKFDISPNVKNLVITSDYIEIDRYIKTEITQKGKLFKLMRNFCKVKKIEFIISLRESKNEWEEDGIWHDDGSRILAFSLSLTLEPPEGGILEIREKSKSLIHQIKTPKYGEIIIFKTGHENFEHKINKVTKGKRLIVAGWCYN